MNELEQAAISIIKKLTEKGFQALYAGGYVRDRILGRGISDIDIATNALPEDIKSLFPRNIPVGEQFGVIVIPIDGVNYEVASFRRDIGCSDGRRPDSVSFSTLEEDVKRRDFTVNGMYYNPLTDETIDLVNGRDDLKRKVIRTIGNPEERFTEDKLRLMRAVRFASTLGFEIEEHTFNAVKKLSPEIKRVSTERIREELLKILTSGNGGNGLVLLDKSGILEHILPEVHAMKGVEQPPQFHPEGDVFTHTRLMLELMESNNPLLAMAVLLHDVGKPSTFVMKDRIRFNRHNEVGKKMTLAICQRLRFSNREIEIISSLVGGHMKFMAVKNMRQSTLKRFLSQEYFELHLKLHRLDCLGSHGSMSSYDFCLEKLEEFSNEEILPEPLLTGKDLIKMGMKPGKFFGKILTAVQNEQLEGNISSRDEAVEFVRKNWS